MYEYGLWIKAIVSRRGCEATQGLPGSRIPKSKL